MTKALRCPSCGMTVGGRDCCRVGSNRYVLEWEGGGYNTTMADSEEDAFRKASLRGNLVPIRESVRLATPVVLQEYYARYSSSMFD